MNCRTKICSTNQRFVAVVSRWDTFVSTITIIAFWRASDRLLHLLITTCKSGGYCSICKLRAAPGAALGISAECKLLLLQSVTKMWHRPSKPEQVSPRWKSPSSWASFRCHFDLDYQYGCTMQLVCHQYGICVDAQKVDIKVWMANTCKQKSYMAFKMSDVPTVKMASMSILDIS